MAVPDGASAFRLPAGSTVWSHGLRNHYEDQYIRRRIEDLPKDEWAAPPITFELPDHRGYASITEAGLADYAGMALQADGDNLLRERLGHRHPASYPYVLRYKEDNAKRLSAAAAIEGRIVTPWRVVLVGGSSLMRLVTNLTARCLPDARLHRSEAFTAVVDGLALATTAESKS